MNVNVSIGIDTYYISIAIYIIILYFTIVILKKIIVKYNWGDCPCYTVTTASILVIVLLMKRRQV